MMETSEAKRVLVVDDDDVVRELAALCLQRAGFEVFVARDGTDAIAFLEDQPVDTIIVDLMMPAMDGIRFVRWLRTEAKKNTPVFVITAAVEGRVEKQAIEAGANRVLYKPIDASELIRVVAES